MTKHVLLDRRGTRTEGREAALKSRQRDLYVLLDLKGTARTNADHIAIADGVPNKVEANVGGCNGLRPSA